MLGQRVEQVHDSVVEVGRSKLRVSRLGGEKRQSEWVEFAVNTRMYLMDMVISICKQKSRYKSEKIELVDINLINK